MELPNWVIFRLFLTKHFCTIMLDAQAWISMIVLSEADSIFIARFPDWLNWICIYSKVVMLPKTGRFSRKLSSTNQDKVLLWILLVAILYLFPFSVSQWLSIAKLVQSDCWPFLVSYGLISVLYSLRIRSNLMYLHSILLSGTFKDIS